MLTIAHRLDTIIASDRILVLSRGEIAEFGPPHELLMKEEGHLAGMVRATGKKKEEHLRKVALEALDKS